MSIRIICELCGEAIERDGLRGEERVRIGIVIGFSPDNVEDVIWRDYHRKCAREITVPTAYNRGGLIPL